MYAPFPIRAAGARPLGYTWTTGAVRCPLAALLNVNKTAAFAAQAAYMSQKLVVVHFHVAWGHADHGACLRMAPWGEAQRFLVHQDQGLKDSWFMIAHFQCSPVHQGLHSQLDRIQSHAYTPLTCSSSSTGWLSQHSMLPQPQVLLRHRYTVAQSRAPGPQAQVQDA